jgi:hypothetical protein
MLYREQIGTEYLRRLYDAFSPHIYSRYLLLWNWKFYETWNMKVSRRIISRVIYRNFAKENPSLNIITSGQFYRRNYLFPALTQNLDSHNAGCSNSHSASTLLKAWKPRPVQLYAGLMLRHIMKNCTKMIASYKQLWHALRWFLYVKFIKRRGIIKPLK